MNKSLSLHADDRRMIVVFGLALVAIVVLTMIAMATLLPSHGPSGGPTPKPTCAVDQVTVWIDDPTPCDLAPGQSLDVAGLPSVTDTPWLLCDDQGGSWVGDGVDLCKRVDH